MHDMKDLKASMEVYTCEDIFCEIDKRFIKALMFHSDMSDLFSFLGLHGFKRLHEYQYFSESKERMDLHHFYLDHCNRLLDTFKCDKAEYTKGIDVIPREWGKYGRMDISSGVVSKYTKQAFEQYREWEQDTKCLYECCASLLEGMDKIVLSEYVASLACDVQKELKEIYRLMECLNISEYDWMYILNIQKKLHKEYKCKMKKVF